MKALFIASSLNVLVSLLAVLGLSAITVAPVPGAEASRNRMMFVAGVLLICWAGVAVWGRPWRRASEPPGWLKGIVLFISVAYMCGVLVVLF